LGREKPGFRLLRYACPVFVMRLDDQRNGKRPAGSARMKETDLVDRLAEHKGLGAAPPEELAWLASHGSLRELQAGDVLTPKGTLVEGLFVVLSGHLAM